MLEVPLFERIFSHTSKSSAAPRLAMKLSLPARIAVVSSVLALNLGAPCRAEPTQTPAVAPTVANAFAAPAPQFWYPPYANAQPAWNGGQLALDLGAAQGKEMAVLSFSVPDTLKAGDNYTFRFVAQASQIAPLIVLVPQAKAGAAPDADGKIAPADSWAQHDGSGQINVGDATRAITFRYTPDQVKDRSIQFFWDKASLETPAQWTFSNFSIVPAGQAAPATISIKSDDSQPFPANFWYPPYADVQPIWREGAVTIDLDAPKNKGQKMAVLTFKLPADLEQDADYRISFNARSSAGGALVIQVPEPDAKGDKEGDKFRARGDWQLHFPGDDKKRSIAFVNRPQLTAGGAQITLYWGEDALANGGTWTLSGFEFAKMN